MVQGKFKKAQVASNKGLENIKQKSVHRVLKQNEKCKSKTKQKKNTIQKIINANLETGMKKNIEKDLQSVARHMEGKSFHLLK